MTDKTKKLFDAPWTVTREEIRKDTVRYGVAKSHLDLVAIDLTHEDAHRLARLPELYEELKSSSYDFCWSCLATLGIDPPTADELIENLCPRKPSCCGYNNRWKLLQKVRDGE